MAIKSYNFLKFFGVFCLTPLPPIVTLTSCSINETNEITNIKCEHNVEFGGCLIDVSPEEFERNGFSLGDSINITFSNNISFLNIPYRSSYYGYNKDVILVKLGNNLHLAQKNTTTDFWKNFNFSDDTTATISMAEKGKYKKLEELLNLQYRNNRSDYNSDEQYANFRCVTGGNLKDDFLYRGCTPSNLKAGDRYIYAQNLMEQNNISFSVNLCDSNEELDELSKDPDIQWSEYLRNIYDNNLFYAFHFSIISDTKESCEDVAKVFKEIISRQNELKNVYVHCNEGKDRTGTICMLIESLCGCDYETIFNDYMMSFKNFYKLDEIKEKERFDAITKYYFNELVHMLIITTNSEAKRQDSYNNADFYQIAENYLKNGDMTDTEIALLITIFSKSSF